MRDYDNNKPLVNPSDIIAEKGSWIKTTLDVWWKALKKSDTIYRWKSYIDRGKEIDMEILIHVQVGIVRMIMKYL